MVEIFWGKSKSLQTNIYWHSSSSTHRILHDELKSRFVVVVVVMVSQSTSATREMEKGKALSTNTLERNGKDGKGYLE